MFPGLRKAFDSVDHKILLKKLYLYGFRGKLFRFLNSYLVLREICAKIDGKISSQRLIEYGVPLGLILSPLFFLLYDFYVNDLPHATNFETTLFADDTKLHMFMSYNKLTIYYTKTCFMLVSKRPLLNCL